MLCPGCRDDPERQSTRNPPSRAGRWLVCTDCEMVGSQELKVQPTQGGDTQCAGAPRGAPLLCDYILYNPVNTRARQGQDPRHAAGNSGGSAGAGGAGRRGGGGAGSLAAAAGAAGRDTDGENEQGVHRSESSGTAAAAKSTTTMAAPTSEEDTSEGPEGGNSGSSNGNSGRGRRRGSTGRQTGGVPTESGRRMGAGCKNRVRGGGGEG